MIGEQLKRLREEKGLSQRRVAARADLDPSTVNQVERGARRATSTTLEKLAAALEVELSELLGYEGVAHHLHVEHLTQIQEIMQSIGNQLDQGNIEYARRFLTIAQEGIDGAIEMAKEMRRIKTGVSADKEVEATDERSEPLADALRQLQANAG